MKTLFVNACVREESRTKQLCDAFLHELNQPFEEVDLNAERLQPLYRDTLADRLDKIEKEDYADAQFRFAHQFAQADCILIGAPCWDLLFPACLKTYIEHICAKGIAFFYDNTGMVRSLCRAQHLVFLSTAGGFLCPSGSIKAHINDLCDMFHIPNHTFYTVEGIDIWGCNVEEKMQEGIAQAREIAQSIRQSAAR